MRMGLLALACVALSGCSDMEPIRVRQPPDWAFTGRFIDVWGSRQAAEITSARRRDGDDIITEVVLARKAGQLMEDGVEVAVVSFQLRISCDPVTYEIVRTTRLAQDGRILGVDDSPNGDDGVDWSPEGPYTGLARQLCSQAAPDQTDFTSLEAFRSEALTRPQLRLTAQPPRVVSPGETR